MPKANKGQAAAGVILAAILAGSYLFSPQQVNPPQRIKPRGNLVLVDGLRTSFNVAKKEAVRRGRDPISAQFIQGKKKIKREHFRLGNRHYIKEWTYSTDPEKIMILANGDTLDLSLDKITWYTEEVGEP